MKKSLFLITLCVLVFSCKSKNNDNSKNDEIISEKKYQAKAPPTQVFDKEAFEPCNKTTLRWLGMGGFFVNSHGTTLMIDPLLGEFDMPVMIDFPIKAENVPNLDAVLITHSDNDHYSIPTNRKLKDVTEEFHSTIYVDSLMTDEGFNSFGHNIGDSFKVGDIKVRILPVDHSWQNAYPGTSDRIFKDEDSCGFWIETPDGIIWATGDSRLMPEQLKMVEPDAILFDWSDSEWHFTIEGAVKLANAYPNSKLLLNHWGSIDAPNFPPFNADPKVLKELVINPERIVLLAPGEPFTLNKIKK